MLKMNELVQRSQTPKSTILYYLKEGLLPEPIRDKPNFHLYDEQCIPLIEFIRYLQRNFQASIAQIKALFAAPHFNIQQPYASLVESLSIIMGAEQHVYEAEALCQEFSISQETLQEWIQRGLIYPRHGIFTATERDMLAILCRCSEAEWHLIQHYTQAAQQLAEKEMALLPHSSAREEKLKHLLDVLLVLKPYLFNMKTLQEHQGTHQA